MSGGPQVCVDTILGVHAGTCGQQSAARFQGPGRFNYLLRAQSPPSNSGRYVCARVHFRRPSLVPSIGVPATEATMALHAPDQPNPLQALPLRLP